MQSTNTTGTDLNLPAQKPHEEPPSENMVWIPGGAFLMGSDKHYPEEAPAHNVKVGAFWMDSRTVTNREFKKFVDETGYVTLAERPANPDNYPGAKPELLAPSSVMFKKSSGPVDLGNHYNWWIYVAGANWKHPRGPASSLQGLWSHPVVHVAFEDAEAYAKWAGKENIYNRIFEVSTRRYCSITPGQLKRWRTSCRPAVIRSFRSVASSMTRMTANASPIVSFESTSRPVS